MKGGGDSRVYNRLIQSISLTSAPQAALNIDARQLFRAVCPIHVQQSIQDAPNGANYDDLPITHTNIPLDIDNRFKSRLRRFSINVIVTTMVVYVILVFCLCVGNALPTTIDM